MSRRCDICGKSPQTGHNVPHSKHRTKRKFHPNLQSRTIEIDGVNHKVKVCTKCLKSL